ncbi:MAG: Gfo/Idh/MocA family protein [Candidatus Hodarchaeota archaeon]
MTFSERPKIAVVGAGRMGRLHIRVLNKMGALHSIVEIDKQVADEYSKRYGILTYSSLEKVMESKSQPDGIILSVPTSLHFTLSKQLLTDYDIKGLLIEKPVTETLEEAEELIDLAKNKKTVIQVGHIEIYNPIVNRMLALLDEDVIGQIQTIKIERRGAVPERRISSLGDVLEDIGIHDLDLISRLMPGDIQLYCTAITVEDVYNSAQIILNNKSKCNGIIILSRQYAGKRRLIEIEGTKGTMSVDLLAQIIQLRSLDMIIGEEKAVHVPFSSGGFFKVYGEPLQEELDDFLTCIQTGSQPKVDLLQGYKALKLVQDCKRSLRDEVVIQTTL